MVEVLAKAKQVSVSPKRVRPIIDMVRGKRVNEAMDILRFLPSPWAGVVAKVVKSAAANAENNLLLDPDKLRITKITADGATPLKRVAFHARGRTGRVKKRFSHITVVVEEVS